MYYCTLAINGTAQLFRLANSARILFNLSWYDIILLTKTTAAQNEDALSYYRVCGLYFLAVVFVRSIVEILLINYNYL